MWVYEREWLCVKARDNVDCVCVCVCVREREREIVRVCERVRESMYVCD